ncbi:MAG: pentapeptide repeat-containing protein, partial [Cyanobacteria bacterium P01_C01_bin.72]
ANFQNADLGSANLQNAYLGFANITETQIKSVCFWDKAIYEGKWSIKQQAIVAIEPDNTEYIEKLKQDKASNPQKAFDCSYWQEDP